MKQLLAGPALKTFLSAFGLIFLAELGDKTQLAAITMSAESGKPWQVFLGAALAMVIITFLACFVGVGIAKVVPKEIIAKVAGVLFVVFGVLIFFGKM